MLKHHFEQRFGTDDFEVSSSTDSDNEDGDAVRVRILTLSDRARQATLTFSRAKGDSGKKESESKDDDAAVPTLGLEKDETMADEVADEIIKEAICIAKVTDDMLKEASLDDVAFNEASDKSSGLKDDKPAAM